MVLGAALLHFDLSQVLNSKPELTPDQALSASAFLGLSEEAIEYFLTIVLCSRASTAGLKRHLEGKLSF